jgi:hypothetical protein
MSIDKRLRIEIEPKLSVLIDFNKPNLDKLVQWWKDRVTYWYYIETNNVKVTPDYNKNIIVLEYDYPNDVKIENIEVNNEMLSDPDDDGNYPIYVKNKNIVSIDRNKSNDGKDVLVSGKLLNSETILQSETTVSGKGGILINCGKDMYVNPKTKRCVQLKNVNIQKLLKQGYKLGIMSGPTNKVKIGDPKNKTDPGVKVLVPPDTSTTKLVFCGKGKVVNPTSGRCVLLSGPVGKKLTSKPYIIVNPPSGPSGPQKTPLFVPSGPKPKPVKGPKQPVVPKVPFKKMKPEQVRTALDTDGDNYVSIREYLDTVESLGPKEKSGKNFAFYNQRDLGIMFILHLIQEFKGPISHIGCIPLFHLCVYKNPNGTFYTMENIKIADKLRCDRILNFYTGSSTNTYASIVIINAPTMHGKHKGNMQVLSPPNLPQLIRNCEKDNKYMVVCDLTLLQTVDFTEMSHANVLIFDTKRKTIERFDPHGGNEYSKVQLAYDSDGNSTGRKDFNKFGNNNNNKNNKLKSFALFNQVSIDLKLQKYMKRVLPNYTYYGTNDTTPYLGPQIKADEYAGLCVTWSCMYMLLRLLNPDLSPAEVTIKMIDGTPKQLRNRILRFQKFIIRTLQKTKKDPKTIK